MANDLTQDPLVVDTAGPDLLLPGPCRIRGCKYIGSGSVVVKDKASDHIVWQASAATQLDVLDLLVKGGIYVPTLSAGTLLIYLGSERGA